MYSRNRATISFIRQKFTTKCPVFPVYYSTSKDNSGFIIRSEFPPVPIQTRPFGETLLEAIWQHNLTQPNRPALISAENPSDYVTYSELFIRIHSTASYLDSIGFSYGDVASVLLPNCWQFLVIYVAVLMRGGCVSALNSLSTDHEFHRAFSETNSKMLFLPDNLMDRVWEVAQKCAHITKLVVIPTTSTDFPNNMPDRIVPFSRLTEEYPKTMNQPLPRIDPKKDFAFLPFSSGTTGPPKAVMLSHQNIGTMAKIFNQHLDNQVLKPMYPNWDWHNENFMLVLPLFHIYGFVLGLNILLSGACGILFKRFDLDLFCSTIQNHKIKLAMLVPPILIALAKSRSKLQKYDLSSLRFIMTGAAPTGHDLIMDVKNAIPSVEQIAQGYGLTEVSMASHLPVYGKDNPTAVGRLAANYEMKVIDIEKRTPLPYGKQGEICCRGPTIMLGYLNKPDATAETIEDGWLRTGDIGYQDEEGWTYVIDRLKELIKVKGFQVAPAELEDLLLSHKDIRDCAVIGIADRNSGEIPKAFVVKALDATDLTERDVKEFIRSRVTSYKQLGAVQFVDEIPKSASGKILRRILRTL